MVLITGASGFVGSALARRLLIERPGQVVAAVRKHSHSLPSGLQTRMVGELSSATRFEEALSGVQVVIHAAARVHVMHDEAVDPLAEYRRVNVEGTLNLARQSAAAGVRRFILVSSIKVNGESTRPGVPFRADDAVKPLDPYAISKLEAERGVQQIAAQSSMASIIIRPPLVYGPGVGANFKKLMQWLQRGLPLPLGAIHNQRSLIALDNLVDLIATCIDHPRAANEVLLAADGMDLSTTQLVRLLREALGVRTPLIPVPAWVLRAGANLLGAAETAERLCGSLQVDIGKTRELLGWRPPAAVEEALLKTAEGFLRETRV